MIALKLSVLMLFIYSASSQFTAYNYPSQRSKIMYPQARRYSSDLPYPPMITFGDSETSKTLAGVASAETTPAPASTDYDGAAEDEGCIASTFKTGADYLWDFAKNNATLQCKIGTANLATKFDEYVTKVAVYSDDELEVFLKEAKGQIAKSFHRALSACQDEITRFNYFFEYEVCVPCGFKC